MTYPFVQSKNSSRQYLSSIYTIFLYSFFWLSLANTTENT